MEFGESYKTAGMKEGIQSSNRFLDSNWFISVTWGTRSVARLAAMPPIDIDQAVLIRFGAKWNENNRRLSRSPPYSSLDLGNYIDDTIATALSQMLGGIPIRTPTSREALIPPEPDCVEIRNIRIVGGVRPQNFDVCYRPDGVRFASDSKTLNDTKSVCKNWQNMVNDLATEATTVHIRFPFAVVAFIVACPEPCVGDTQRKAMIETLERLARRNEIGDPPHMAEAISLILWNPDNGEIDNQTPAPNSPLRFESFSKFIETAYVNRYKGLPPHVVEEEAHVEAEEEVEGQTKLT